MTAVVHRMNLFIHTDRAYGRNTQSVVDSVSVFLQLMLFPDTPDSVLGSLGLSAGAVQFRERGYHRTSVDDIVEEAGFARGTFYKYFSEKQDLLVALSAEAITATVEFADELTHIDPMSDDDTELRAWLD
eukprot:gene27618-33367_t